MEEIHLKTKDPIDRYLLRLAAARQIDLGWERYERLEPRDGFLRLGLSCPYGCMQGPCRIDPLGRGPDRGLCGIDSDQMVAAFLARLCIFGALESLGYKRKERAFDALWPSDLQSKAVESWEALGAGSSNPTDEIYRSAVHLQRPSEPPEILIRRALRLALVSVGMLACGCKEIGQPSRLRIAGGYGLLAEGGIFIGVSGRPSRERITALFKEAKAGRGYNARIVSLGDWIALQDAMLPCACSSAEAEILVSSGKINLLLAGPRADPSMIELCNRMGIPVSDPTNNMAPEALIGMARGSFMSRPASHAFQGLPLVEEAEVVVSRDGLQGFLQGDCEEGFVIMGGPDGLERTLGTLPTELARAFREKGLRIASWSDAALWIIKDGIHRELSDSELVILDEATGPLLAVTGLAAAGRLKELKGICLTGLKSCLDLTVALGLAALGLNVCVAAPIPVWGSQRLREELDACIRELGGSLIHYDHRPKKEEILDYLLRRSKTA